MTAIFPERKKPGKRLKMTEFRVFVFDEFTIMDIIGRPLFFHMGTESPTVRRIHKNNYAKRGGLLCIITNIIIHILNSK
jgi:hypothetical protein